MSKVIQLPKGESACPFPALTRGFPRNSVTAADGDGRSWQPSLTEPRVVSESSLVRPARAVCHGENLKVNNDVVIIAAWGALYPSRFTIDRQVFVAPHAFSNPPLQRYCATLNLVPQCGMAACFHCEMYERSPFTTQGVFCTAACEDKWVKACLAKLSDEDCLDLMCQVMTKTQAAVDKQVKQKEQALAVGK